MSVISDAAPTVTYVSSSDTGTPTDAGTEYGTNTFLITFDLSLSTLGTVIMFEYKLQDINVTDPNLENVTGGFITIENAIQAGITNQYIISIPAEENTWDAVVTKIIQCRVYAGHKTPVGSGQNQDIVVTDWSIGLGVHNPPCKPHIGLYEVSSVLQPMAYYNPNSVGADDSLYVLLDVDTINNINTYDYDEINFIVCYFFKNLSGSTIWQVSSPLEAVPSTITGYNMITVLDIGEVSTDPAYAKVYCSVHAVYSWTEAGLKYNAVSEMSNEVTALAGSNSTVSTISADYDDNTQIITVSWTQPGASSLPIYSIDHYELYQSDNGGHTYDLYGTYLPTTVLEQEIDISASNCGESFMYMVKVFYVNFGLVTDSSETTEIFMFKYASAVSNLQIDSSTVNGNGNINLTVSFDGSTFVGCGDVPVYVIKISDVEYNAEIVYVDYNGNDMSGSLDHQAELHYQVTFEDVDASRYGTVEVYLQTTDTNSSTRKNGASQTTYYIAANFDMLTIDYGVYATHPAVPDQKITINWEPIPSSVLGAPAPNWFVHEYKIEREDGLNSNVWIDVTTDGVVDNVNQIFEYNVFAIENVLVNLRVIAIMKTDTTPQITFDITSTNNLSKYIFTYPTNPTITLNWAVVDEDPDKMDIKGSIIEGNNGINGGVVKYVIQVFDNTNTNQIGSDVELTDDGEFNFNAIDFVDSGIIRAYTVVDDNNAVRELSYHYSNINFESTVIPKFVNTNLTGGVFTGDIVTNTLLQPKAAVVFPNSSGLLETVGIYFDGSTNPTGFTVTYPLVRSGINGEYIYHFELTNGTDAVGGMNRTAAIILASNTAGLGSVTTPFP